MPIIGVIASSISGNLYSASYDSIATATPTSGSVTFSSIPQTYRHLQVRAMWRSINASVADGFIMRFNGTTSTYASHWLQGDGATATMNSQTGNNAMRFTQAPGANAGSNVFGVAIIDIYDYANTNKNKTAKFLAGFDNAGSGQVALDSGLWVNTAAVNSITFFPNLSNDFAAGTHIALYGIRE